MSRWRRKQTSKRRWLARFCMGQFIPYLVLVEYPSLRERMKPCVYFANRDGVQRG